MGYKKDILGSFAYEFEPSQFLMKSFACAHGEIKGSRLWWNILLKQNVKFHPPKRVDETEKVQHRMVLDFFWKGCTNSNPFQFLIYVFELLHILQGIWTDAIVF